MTYRTCFFLLLIAAITKFIAIFYTNFDLFGDEAQYWLWSKELDFGYYSKPPLLAWIIRIVTSVFGNSFITLKLIPFFFYFFTTYVIFLLTLDLYNKTHLATISALSFYLMPSVTISSFLLSTDVVLVFFSSLCLLLLLKIRNEPRYINFLLLGIFLGMAFLTKYAAAYFLLSLIVFLFFDKKTRKIFFMNKFGSLMFVLSAFTISLSNIIWNVKNNWVSLSHTSENAGLNRAGFNLFNGLEFTLTQGIMLGPLLFVGFIFFINKLEFSFQTKFLLSFSLPVFAIVFLESVLVRANANWAAVALVPFFILIFKHLYTYSKRIIVLNNIINFIFCFIFFLLIGMSSPLKIFNRINGISSFSYLLKENYLQNQKYLVVEDRLIYSNLGYSLRNEQIVIFTSYDPNKEIKSHFHLSQPLLSDFNKNFIFIGNLNELNYLQNKNEVKLMEKLEVPFNKNTIKIYEVFF